MAGGPSASNSSGDTPIDLCARNTSVQIISAIVKETSESSAPRNRNEQMPAVACSSKNIGYDLESRSQTGDKEHEEGDLIPNYLRIRNTRREYFTNLGRESESS